MIAVERKRNAIEYTLLAEDAKNSVERHFAFTVQTHPISMDSLYPHQGKEMGSVLPILERH